MTTQTVQSKTFVASAGDIALYVVTALLALGLGVLLWMIGGFFTIVALKELLTPGGVVLSASTERALWLVPLAVSAVEIAALKFGTRLPRWLLGLCGVITVLDLASTFIGTHLWLAAIDITTVTGFGQIYILAQQYDTLTCGLSSIALTFAQEKLILASAGMLWTVATGLYRAWRGR